MTIEQQVTDLQRDITNLKDLVRDHAWRIECLESVNAAKEPSACEAASQPFVMQVGRRYRCRNGKEAECKSSDGGFYEDRLYRWCMVSCNEFFTVNDIGVRFVGEANDYDIVAYADAPRAEPSHPRYASGEVPAVGDVASFNDGNRMCTFTVDSISDDWVKTFSQMPYPTKMCRLIRRADATEPASDGEKSLDDWYIGGKIIKVDAESMLVEDRIGARKRIQIPCDRQELAAKDAEIARLNEDKAILDQLFKQTEKSLTESERANAKLQADLAAARTQIEQLKEQNEFCLDSAVVNEPMKKMIAERDSALDKVALLESDLREAEKHVVAICEERDAALARAEAGPSFVMEVGRRYRCRNGQEVTCVNNSPEYVKCFKMQNDLNVFEVGYDGRVLLESTDHKYDIVSYADEPRADATEPALAKNISDSASVMLPSMTELVELADSPESDAWLNDKSFADATEQASDGKSLGQIAYEAYGYADYLWRVCSNQDTWERVGAAVAAAATKAKDRELDQSKLAGVSLMNERNQLAETVKAKDAEIAQLRVQAAGCLTAAEGGTMPEVVATEGMYGWSFAYQKVLELRRNFDFLRKAHDEQRSTIIGLQAERDGKIETINMLQAECDKLQADLAAAEQEVTNHKRMNKSQKDHIVVVANIVGRDHESSLSEIEDSVRGLKAERDAALARAEAAEKEAAKRKPLQSLANEIREINKANGWNVTQPVDWSDTYKVPAILALITSEVSEALEAFRKDDALNFCEEMADTLIRVLDCIAAFDLDFDATVRAKLEKNKTRGHKHGGKRV